MFKFYSIVAMLCCASIANTAEMIIDEGFESGLGAMQCSGNCPTISTDHKDSGKYSGSFLLDRSMKTPYRTEVILREKKGHFDFGKEYWLNIDYRYSNWKLDKNAEASPLQVHTTPSDWSKCKILTASGSSSARATAPFAMFSKNGVAEFITYGANVQWTGPIVVNNWNNIIVHFKISAGSDGFVEAWRDNKKLFRVDGANSPKLDTCNQKPRAPYFKTGVYKWAWKPGRPATDSTVRHLYLDNIRVALGADGYALVAGKDTPVIEPPIVGPPIVISPVEPPEGGFADKLQLCVNACF